jgi:gamma-glutamyltranspeptidase
MELSASGPSWAIASPHTDATAAGGAAFERGGNAIDAALATAVTLGVSYPHMCGVGGDLFALVQRPDGSTVAIASTGRSATHLDVDSVRGRHKAVPVRGPIPVTVPGAVAGWEAVHRVGAQLPWAGAFDRAVSLAADGAVVSRSLHQILTASDAPHATDPGLRPIFYPRGSPASLGATFANPQLARTLEVLATEGASAMYGGEIGRSYVEGLREIGSALTIDDLVAHEASMPPPLTASFRELQISVVPPTSQGFVLLEVLMTIDRLGLDPDPHGPDAGAIASVFSHASRDRDLHLADPDDMRTTVAALLDDARSAEIANVVRTRAAEGSARSKAPGDTIALVTADAKGWAVSLIQSLFWDFGAGILEPGTGIVAQNRGACFTLEAGHPNVLAPGKRPAHTLMPVLVHDERGLAAVAGSMGGYGQPQINAQTIAHAMVAGRPAGDAIATPRWVIDTDPGSTERSAIAEEGVPIAAKASLAAAGFAVEDVPSTTEALGHAHLIRLLPSELEVGSDPRADGAAAAG